MKPKQLLLAIVVVAGMCHLLQAQPGVIWTRTYGGGSNDHGHSVQQTSDGGFVVAGYTSSFGAGGGDVWLVRTDANGDTLWTRTFGGSNYDYGRSVQQTSDGGVIIAAQTRSFGAALNGNAWLIKTNEFGDTLWTSIYGFDPLEPNFSSNATCVQPTVDGGYIFTGTKTVKYNPSPSYTSYYLDSTTKCNIGFNAEKYLIRCFESKAFSRTVV